MPGRRKNSLEAKIKNRIRRSTLSVFVRSDFSDFDRQYDSYQVSRALKKLVQEGTLLKSGYGVYLKSKKSLLSGRTIPAVDVEEMVRQTCKKLKLQQVPTEMEQAYNAGQSTQVPTGRVIAVKGARISRQLEYNGVKLAYARA